MSHFSRRTSQAHVMRLVTLGVTLVTMGPVAAADSDPTSSTGYPDNPVSDYVDRSSDGLTSYEAPATLDESISSVEVATPSAAPVKAPKPAEWAFSGDLSAVVPVGVETPLSPALHRLAELQQQLAPPVGDDAAPGEQAVPARTWP